MDQLTDREQSVLDLIDPQDLGRLTQTLVDAGGENPGGTEELTVSALEREGRARGLQAEVRLVAPGRPNIDLDLPAQGPIGDGPGLLFLGHSDVVPAGPGWSREPFRSEVADGRVFGRGSTDMKGGLAAVLVAMDALRRSGIALSGPLRLACTMDEEDLGLGIRHLSARGLGPGAWDVSSWDAWSQSRRICRRSSAAGATCTWSWRSPACPRTRAARPMVAMPSTPPSAS